MLTNLETDALRVITELARDWNRAPATVEVAHELDVSYDEAQRVLLDLRETRHVDTDGTWWYPRKKVDLLPDDVFVGFFEDLKLVEEVHACVLSG